MSLIQRKPVSIGRAERKQRDDRYFLVATEDTYAPQQYFEVLTLPRVRVLVLETPEGTGHSSPRHVVDRLKKAFAMVRQKGEVQQGDEFWVLLDTDHHIKDSHIKGTIEALKMASQADFEVAFSNPSFELWLLLHHVDVPPGTVFANANEVIAELKRVLGSYDKTLIGAGMFPLSNIPAAIERARALEVSPDEPQGHWPETAGTRIYRLFERALPGGRLG